MKRLQTLLRDHSLLAAILAAFIALTTIYSVATPIFEAGDEVWHYPVVQHIASGRGLPIQDPSAETLWEQEGGQPPLYYAISALATFWIDTRDLAERRWINPHAKIGIPLAFGNKNLIVHTSAEDFPWRGTTLAVHLIRFLSILFSAIAVALTYLLALEIGNGHVIASTFASLSVNHVVSEVNPSAKQSPKDEGDCLLRLSLSTASFDSAELRSAQDAPRNDAARKTLAALAAAFIAFNPMFVFISASVNNDNLAVMLATLALFWLAQLITRGATLKRFVCLGIVLGFAALTKVSDLGLLVLAAVVFAYLLWKERERERERERGRGREGDTLPRSRAPTLPLFIVRGSLICATIVVAIALWWYVRNWMLYGDPLALNVWLAIAGARPQPFPLAALLSEFQGFRISFWGNFGGVNIIAADWVYVALDALTVVAGIGLLIGVARRTLPRLLALPALWLGIVFVLLIRWTMMTYASQGRLIFPAIGAVGILLAHGLGQFQVAGFKVSGFQVLRNSQFAVRTLSFVIRHLPFVICSLLFLFATLTPFILIAPAYALPARVADATPSHAVGITFGDHVELIGYDLQQETVAPNSYLPITIYWRSQTRLAEDFSIYIHLLDAAGNKIGEWDAYPGNGLYPTRLWQAGEVIVDAYRVPLAPDARGPQVARVEVGMYRKAGLQTLPARDAQGRAITPTIARFKIAGRADVRTENPVEYAFDDQVALVGYALPAQVARGETLTVRLYWRALAAMDEDYAVFVHLVDTRGKVIAQKDDQPQSGAYPTSFWDAGEVVADAYRIAIPRDELTQEFEVRVGVYRARDGSRLPVRGGDGSTSLTTGYVVVGRVRVTP